MQTFDPKLPIQSSSDFEIKIRKPKVLCWDVETAPNRSFTWGKWQQDVIEFQAEWYMLAWSGKWLDGKQITRGLPDYDGYIPNTEDDKALIIDLHKLLEQADVFVYHNGDKFDLKKANTRFIEHGLKPIQPKPSVDTLKAARRYFSFNSNKLDDLGRRLEVGRKAQTGGFELWRECMNGNPKAWNRMKKYCGQDVRLLEAVYYKMLPFIQNHPNMTVLADRDFGCRNCGSSKIIKRGSKPTATGRRQSYQCQDCGAWMSGKHEPRVEIR